MLFSKKKNKNIELALQKVRQRHDDYIVTFYKDSRYKNAFEDRYLQALRGRVDLLSFLFAEYQAIDQLFNQEQEKAGQPTLEKMPPKAGGSTDAIMARMDKMIAAYPQFDFFPEMELDVRKIIAVMQQIEKEKWPLLEKNTRSLFQIGARSPLLVLEQQILEFCSFKADKLPPVLERYQVLQRQGASAFAKEKEEKWILKKAAFWLHRARRLALSSAKMEDDLVEGQKKVIESFGREIEAIIRDFRLKDIKPAD